MFSAIQFINERIIQSEEAFESESLLRRAVSLFDPELLESLAGMVTESHVQSLEFTANIAGQVRASSTGTITEYRANRLKSYVDFIRSHFYGERDLDVIGTIVELRSRDPDGSKNYIRVLTEFHGERTFVSATLSNAQYQRAVDAHKGKHPVRLVGHGIRLRTHIRIDELLEFEGYGPISQDP